MENSAGAGGTIGRSLEELGAIFAGVDDHPRLGICLDSCHLYASGYDVTDSAAVDELVEQIDREIGIDRLRALHVNDSAMPLGSNRDRHANILEGLIGEGLGVFLAHPAFQQLSAYLEVAGATATAPASTSWKRARAAQARAGQSEAARQASGGEEAYVTAARAVSLEPRPGAWHRAVSLRPMAIEPRPGAWHRPCPFGHPRCDEDAGGGVGAV